MVLSLRFKSSFVHHLGKLGQLKDKLREAEDEMVKALAGIYLCWLKFNLIENVQSVFLCNLLFLSFSL